MVVQSATASVNPTTHIRFTWSHTGCGDAQHLRTQTSDPRHFLFATAGTHRAARALLPDHTVVVVELELRLDVVLQRLELLLSEEPLDE